MTTVQADVLISSKGGDKKRSSAAHFVIFLATGSCLSSTIF